MTQARPSRRRDSSLSDIERLGMIIVPSRNNHYGRIERVKEILDGGCNLNQCWDGIKMNGMLSGGGVVYTHDWATEIRHNSPVFQAVAKDDVEMLELLLNFKADLTLKNKAGMTALHEAVLMSKLESTRFLASKIVRAGGTLDLTSTTDPTVLANVNAKNTGEQSFLYRESGYSALHMACLEGSLPLVDILLQGGADFQLPTRHGFMALDIAFIDRQDGLAELLLNRGATLSEPESDCLSSVQALSTVEQGRLAEDLVRRGILQSTHLQQQFFAHTAFVLAAGSLIQTRSEIRSMIDVLQSRLLDIAGLPLKMGWQRRFCCKCDEFQRQDYSSMCEPFSHHENISNLRDSAVNGCLLCQTIIQAIDADHQRERGKAETNLKHSPVSDQSYSEHMLDLLNPARHSRAVAPEPSITMQCVFRGRGRLDGTFLRIVWGREIGNPGHNLSLFEVDDETVWRHIIELNISLVDAPLAKAINDTEPFVARGTSSHRSFATAKVWLDSCLTSHKACTTHTENCLPARVVNVGNPGEDPFLYVSAGECEPYLTLSYCWGPANLATTTKSNLEARRQGISLESLPATLQDAILTTRKFGYRYLWIDALCIIQDSHEDWLQQAAKMGDIYAHSSLTLAAADSATCSEGLFRAPAHHGRDFIPLDLRCPSGLHLDDGGGRTSSVKRLMVNKTCGEGIYRSERPSEILDTRGWTLQETILSRRVLKFCKDELWWECQEISASECRPWGVGRGSIGDGEAMNNHRFSRRMFAGAESWNPSHDLNMIYMEWKSLVTDYTNRKLTKPSDRLAAFMGVHSCLSKALGEDQIAGIWTGENVWDSLLWYTEKELQGFKAPRAVFPSWSWCAVPHGIEFLASRRQTPPAFTAGELQLLSWNMDDESTTAEVKGSITVRGLLKRMRVVDNESLDIPWQARYPNLEKREGGSPKLTKIHKDWPGDGLDMTWCLVIYESPPVKEKEEFRFSEHPDPGYCICMCLVPISVERLVFRRVGAVQVPGIDYFRDGASVETIIIE